MIVDKSKLSQLIVSLCLYSNLINKSVSKEIFPLTPSYLKIRFSKKGSIQGRL